MTPAKPHLWLVRTLIGLATLLGIIAIFAVWANRQLLDTSYWTSTSTKLIESPPIREEVAIYLTDQLYTNVNVTEELRKELPSQVKPLAAPAAGALRDVIEKAVVLLLERPRVQELWSKANGITHAAFVRLVENHGTVVKLPGGGAVVLNLRPMLTEIAEKVGASPSVVGKIPPQAAEIRIASSNTLKTMQSAINLLRSLAIALPLLVFALFALAVYLARGWRRHTLIDVGAGFVVAGLVVVVARGIIGGKVVDSLATTEAVRPAAQAVWSIGTSVLADIAWSTVLVGVFVILAGLLAGPTKAATSLRRLMSPYLRERPDLTFGVVALLLLLLFLWGPITATKTLIGIVIITVLAFFGTQMLRRETALEFPVPPPSVGRSTGAASEELGGSGPKQAETDTPIDKSASPSRDD